MLRDSADRALAGGNQGRAGTAITWCRCRTWPTPTRRPAGRRRCRIADGRVARAAVRRIRSASDWSDDILCAYYGGEFLYTQRIAINQRYKYVFNGFDFDELYDLERDPEEMRNVVDTPEYSKQTEDMRQRLWAMMNKFEDPYGDVQARNSIGQKPDRYGAARYLPRG